MSSVGQRAANLLLERCTKVEELFVNCYSEDAGGLRTSELLSTLITAPFLVCLVDIDALLAGPSTSRLRDLCIQSSLCGNFEIVVPLIFRHAPLRSFELQGICMPELLDWIITKPLITFALDTPPMGRQFPQPHLPNLPLTLANFTLNSWTLPPLPSLQSFLSALPPTLSADITLAKHRYAYPSPFYPDTLDLVEPDDGKGNTEYCTVTCLLGEDEKM
ncbi:hypothetical protein JCM8547_003739 [Rhodosporidiobolus lusitaniae]